MLIPAAALLILIGMAVVWLIYYVATDAALWDGIKNLDPSAVSSAISAESTLRVIVSTVAAITIVVGGYLIVQNGGVEAVVNQAKNSGSVAVPGLD